MTPHQSLRALARAAHSNAVLILTTLLFASHASAGVNLAWDPVSSASGYYVHYGTSPGNYVGKIHVGNVTAFTVDGLPEGATYYFAASGYDTGGSESATSNEAASVVPYGVPMAEFAASATSGVAPLAINLVNLSTGSIASYAWDFGDGTTSTVENPAHVYSTPGVYSVSLTVAGPGGTDTGVQTNLVTVNASNALLAQFVSTATIGFAPLDVSFTSTSTGAVETYAWSFGDGTTSTEPNPSHTFAAPGGYTVTLTVTGPTGINAVARTNYVRVRRQAP